MSRRIEIELTSDRGDGTWTWRAAGARQPKGVLPATLLPAGAAVGDVVRAELEIGIDGVDVQSVAAGPARVRAEPERLELHRGAVTDDQLVTTHLVRPERAERGDRRDRGPLRDRDRGPGGGGGGGGDRGARDGARREGGGGDRPRPERSDRPRQDRPPRPEGEAGTGPGARRERRPERPDRPRRPAPPPMPERPKPKRLRPGRTHRRAVLAELAPEQQPIAEQVLKGGIPSVRQAIDAENVKRAEAGDGPIPNADELLAMAEAVLPRLRSADWRDRAEAAIADADELDLRDLRSVVVAADVAARDDEAKALAAQLRTKLDERVEAEQATWLDDLRLALTSGRIVRALRLSSRPPKAGTILDPEVKVALAEASCAALAADVGADRWGAVLDAAAYAPVRGDVKPASVPETPGDDLLAVVKKYASRVPGVAAAFGIAAPARPAGRSMRPPRPPAGRRPGQVPVGPRPANPKIGDTIAPVAAAADPPAADPVREPAPSAPTGAPGQLVHDEPVSARGPDHADLAQEGAPRAEAGADGPLVREEPVAARGPDAAADPVREPAPSAPTGAPGQLAHDEPVGARGPDHADLAQEGAPRAEAGADGPLVREEPVATRGPDDPTPTPEPPSVVTGMPEAATPVEATVPDPVDAPVEAPPPGASEVALEAAPDVDDVSDGEPAG